MRESLIAVQQRNRWNNLAQGFRAGCTLYILHGYLTSYTWRPPTADAFDD